MSAALSNCFLSFLTAALGNYSGFWGQEMGCGSKINQNVDVVSKLRNGERREESRVQDRKGLDLPEDTTAGKMNTRALGREVADGGGDHVLGTGGNTALGTKWQGSPLY